MYMYMIHVTPMARSEANLHLHD